MSVLLALALAVQAPETTIARLFAVTPMDPFISYSWGEHWTRLRSDLRGLEGEIEVMVCLGPWVYAGGTNGLFVSDDYGETYRPVASWTRGAPAVTSILTARLFGLEPTIFLGTADGLYRSKDAGAKWIRVGEAEIRGAVRDMSWPGPELFIATDGGLFRTRDMGEELERVGKRLPGSPLLALAVSRYFAIEPVVFVGTGGAGLHKSADGGETFEAVGADVLGKEAVGSLVWWGGLLLVGTDSGLYLSDDGGKTFRKAPDLEGRRVRALAVPGAESDVPSDVIVGTDLGVFKSSDGARRFRRVQEGMGPLEIRVLATFPLPPQDRELRSR
jgi:photosystem II stability/assembly factor-like uncharacterized protein